MDIVLKLSNPVKLNFPVGRAPGVIWLIDKEDSP